MTGRIGFPFVEVELADGVGVAPTQPCRLTRFSGPGHYYSANHPGKFVISDLRFTSAKAAASLVQLVNRHSQIVNQNGCQTWTRTKTSGLTGRRATLTPSGNGAAGRIPTCIVPFRRRMPHVFDHGSNLNWSEWQDFHLRPPGPKPGALKTELHSEKNGGREGSCTLNPPADNWAL